ncbi:MAG: LacI family DNA-binding transcriptional regulator [Clostridia bacterium]
MERRTTIRDIARAAGVSTSTVSRFLNGTGYIGDETRQRVALAVECAHYTPSMAAKGLKTRKSNFIVLVVPDIGNPFYAKMARTLQRLAENDGYVMVLLDSNELPEKERAAVSLAARIYAAGLIIASIGSCAHAAPLVKQYAMPTVGFSAYEAPSAFDLVTVDRHGGTHLAVSHLVALGHKRIVFAGGRADSGIAVGRREGFLSQMRLEHLASGDDAVLETGFSQEDGYRAGMAFANRAQRPTAICCANDLLAFGVIKALFDCGLRIPEDVSVTGMDDVPYATIANPRLTTVTNDGALFAQRGYEMLLSRVSGQYAGSYRHTQIPNRLIVRASTAVPASE